MCGESEAMSSVLLRVQRCCRLKLSPPSPYLTRISILLMNVFSVMVTLSGLCTTTPTYDYVGAAVS